MNKEKIFNFLRKNKYILNKYGVKNIALFGSYANGKSKKESDLDFLVEFELGKKNFDNFMDLKFFLEDNLDKKVDLVIKENIKEELKEKILRNAKYL